MFDGVTNGKQSAGRSVTNVQRGSQQRGSGDKGELMGMESTRMGESRAPLDRERTPARRRRRTASLVVALTLVMALAGGACAAPSPPAGPGGPTITFGPLTIPLPPIQVRPPATSIPLLGGLCNIPYQGPGVAIIGATVTVPAVQIDPSLTVFTVPNVVVRIPQLRIPLSTVGLVCGPLNLSAQVDLIIPSTVLVRAATLNLTARTITLQNPSFTINGAGLGINALSLIIPLPPILNIPLPTTAIGF